MIRETIITTRREDGSAHIAPMGLRKEGELYLLAPFRPSSTLENLNRERNVVVNYTDDVRVFAGCITGRRDWPTCPSKTVAAPRLTHCLAHEELEVERVEDDELRPRFYCRRLHMETHEPFMGFNRAQAAVLEGAILVSRLHMLPWEKIESEMHYLKIAIDKTAGERELEAWQWILAAISAHQEKTRG